MTKHVALYKLTKWTSENRGKGESYREVVMLRLFGMVCKVLFYMHV